VLSGGSFISRVDNFADLAMATQLEAMSIMGYDAITLGDRELALEPKIVQELTDINRSPIVCSNLRYNGENLWVRVKIIQQGDISVAILGVNESSKNRQDSNGLPSSWTVDEPEGTMTLLLDSLKNQVEVVILLSQLGFWDTLELLNRFPEIQIAIVGNEGRTVQSPIHYNSAIIVMPGNRGQYLGELDLTFDKQGHILSSSGQLIPLTENIPDDPEISALVAEFKHRVDDRVAETDTLSHQVTDNSQISNGEYVGAISCQGCHTWIYTKWQVTPHRNAFQTLYREKQVNNEKCVVCHSVGYGKGGFTSVDDTPQLMNVQCESCHGKGAQHVDNPKIPMPLKITETTCRECHCGEWEKGFDFSTAVKAVH
jgi:hypothetical protein